MSKKKIISMVLALALFFSIIPIASIGATAVFAQEGAISVQVLVEPSLEFDTVDDFHDGVSAFKKDGKYGFVDKTGKIVVSPVYDRVSAFSEGLARVTKDEKSGYIDKTGKIVIPINYGIAGDFSEGLAAVWSSSQWNRMQWTEFGTGIGYIDVTGKLVIPTMFGYAGAPGSFHEGLAKVYKYDKFGYIDRTGNLVVPAEYDNAYDFSEGLAAVQKDGQYRYIDKTGKIAVPYGGGIQPFSEGLAIVSNGEKYGYVNKTGEVVIPFEYDYGYPFKDGMTICYSYAGGDYVVINKNGEIIARTQEPGVKVGDGFVRVPTNKEGEPYYFHKVAYIDQSGNTILKFEDHEYDYYYDFNEGLARVENDVDSDIAGLRVRKYGFINKTGKLVVPVIYDYDIYTAHQFHDGVAWVKKDGKFGILQIVEGAAEPETIDDTADGVTAAPTASTVLVDGADTAFDAYSINDNNYAGVK